MPYEYTGSSYDGPTVNGRPEGQGEYTFPDGVKYVGSFKQGMFHGSGKLVFPGGEYHATWDHGEEVKGSYTFNDGLKFAGSSTESEKPWGYATKKDRRFYTETTAGKIHAAGDEQLTNAVPSPALPAGCYDTGDGYYDPAKAAIFAYDSGSKVREPSSDEVEWILSTCRVAAPVVEDGAGGGSDA
jgi:hypothetical protein